MPRERCLRHTYETIIEILRPARACNGHVVDTQGSRREAHLRAGVRGEMTGLVGRGNLLNGGRRPVGCQHGREIRRSSGLRAGIELLLTRLLARAILYLYLLVG